MVQRHPAVPLPSLEYPVDPWRLVERRCVVGDLAQAETLFTLANGYLGLRGNHEEGPAGVRAQHAGGCFDETWPISCAEQAFGLARTGQTIVDVPDAKIIKLYVDDEPLFLPTAPISGYERVLDFRSGTVDGG